MSLQNKIVDILVQVLSLNPIDAGHLTDDSPLLGAIPEFDSMAVVSIITTIEERFDVVVDDDEIEAAVFETLGSLVSFVKAKL
jgi:acyl carrier protein